MWRCPLASQKYAPCARWTKRGVPPTARKARTGELTPPGISARARSKSSAFLSVFGVMRGEVESLDCVTGLVVRLHDLGLRPEQAVGHHVAHAGAEAAIEAAIEVGQRFAGRGGEVRPAGNQG